MDFSIPFFPPQALDIITAVASTLGALLVGRRLIGPLIDRASERLGGFFRLIITASTIILLPITLQAHMGEMLYPAVLLYAIVILLMYKPLREIFSGDALKLSGTLARGDYVELGDLNARVVAVKTFATEFITADLRKIYIPNSVLMASRLVNFTKSGAGLVTLRVRVDGKRMPIADAKLVMLKTGVDIAKSEMASGRAAEVKVVGIDGDNVDLQLTLYVSNPAKAESLTPIIMERIFTKLSDVTQRAYL